MHNIEKPKRIAILIFIFILIIIGLIIAGFLKKDDSELPPIELREQAEKEEKGTLKLVETFPESGTVVRDLSSGIILTFDHPVNADSLEMSVEPSIPLGVVKTEEDNRSLYIYPEKYWWTDGTTYRIIISSLEGTEGQKLEEPIIFKYTRDPADDIIMGDPPPGGLN